MSEKVFVSESVADAVERSLLAAVGLDDSHAAGVAVLRVMARRIDVLEPLGFVDDNGKLDNVTVPTFLKYLSALGLVVESVSAGKGAGGKGVAPVTVLGEWRREKSG